VVGGTNMRTRQLNLKTVSENVIDSFVKLSLQLFTDKNFFLFTGGKILQSIAPDPEIF
jgi:hypothetical protein